MADPRTSFTILEDASSQAGLPLHKVLEGDAYSAKNALPALVAKDVTGLLLKYLQVDGNNRLMVNSSGAIVSKKNSPAGELATGSASIVLVTGAEIVLTAGKTYQDISVICSCRRDAIFQLIQQDDVTETVLAEFVVGSGAFTLVEEIPNFSVTAGATGVQKLKIKAKNFEALSSLRASLYCGEVQ